jgi:general secretion pathway protein K
MRITERRGPSARRRRRGGALLTVLWMSAALAAIALSVSTSVRTETDHVAATADGLRAHYLATGSVERAVQWMLWGPGGALPDGSVRFWQPDKRRLSMTYPTGDAVVEVIPESAKLDINRASPDDLVRVVAAVTGDIPLAQQIAAGILEWRGSGPPVFDAYYQALGPTFRPRRASFEEIEELLFVRGVTPELFYGNYIADAQGQLYARGGLRDCLSVWGSLGPFDVNGASPALLEAMTGMPAAAAQALVARRAVRPFANIGEVAQMGVPVTRLRVGGNRMFTLRATARLRRSDGTPTDVVRSAAAVILFSLEQRFQPMPVRVVRFYEDAWSEFAVRPPAAQGVVR